MIRVLAAVHLAFLVLAASGQAVAHAQQLDDVRALQQRMQQLADQKQKLIAEQEKLKGWEQEMVGESRQLDDFGQRIEQAKARYRNNPSNEMLAEVNDAVDRYNQWVRAWRQKVANFKAYLGWHSHAVEEYNRQVDVLKSAAAAVASRPSAQPRDGAPVKGRIKPYEIQPSSGATYRYDENATAPASGRR